MAHGGPSDGTMVLTSVVEGRQLPWHWLAALLVIAMLWTGIGVTLRHDHTVAETNAETQSANLARAFDENITRTVEAIDQALLFARLAYQFDPSGLEADARVTSSPFLNDLHVQLAFSDDQGRLVWSNLKGAANISIADRPHFREQRDSTADQLYISNTVIGRVSNRQTVQFTRKRLKPDGSFGGVVIISIDPDYFARFYESISIGNGSILLANAEGTILARASRGMSVTSVPMPELMRRRLLQDRESGNYRVISSIDGVERITGFRRLARYNLFVNVGLAVSDVFAPYERNRRLYVAAGVVLSGLAVIVASILSRQRRSLIGSRRDLAATLEAMSQGIAVVRPDGHISVFNQRAVALLGLPPDLMAAQPTLRALFEWQRANGEFANAESIDETVREHLVSGDGLHGDFAYQRTRPNGTVLEICTRVMPDGSTLRTYTDITEQRARSDALAAAQERGAHAERMQALGQLAGGIAHDFNNILQAVLGAGSLIVSRAEEPGSVTRYARMILEAAERGASITRRLLAFARRGELRAERLDAGSLVEGLHEILNHTLGSRIEVTVEIASGLPPVVADKGQLETVLINLATNARDAMPDGGTLGFHLAVENVIGAADNPAGLQPGRYVRLSVTDTGTGMDKALLARAMEPFFTTKPVGRGTGLGLPMVKGFAEQSEGGMSIASEPGNGTIVHIWLPAAGVLQERGGVIRAATPAPNLPRKIMLIQHDVSARSALAAALEDAGYIVIARSHGSDAMAALIGGGIVDVLVYDLSEPESNGLTIVRQAQQAQPHLAVVLLTGYAGYGAQLAVGETLNNRFALMRATASPMQLIDRIETLVAAAPGVPVSVQREDVCY